jgi:adenosylcobyric acid synthase
MTRTIMVQGATSGAGKTMVTALLCRHYAKQGKRVAPFKTQNLSLNSYVSNDGGEMGISQAFQAWACEREPDWRMNPILLKPRIEGGCQVVLNGRPYRDVDITTKKIDRNMLLGAAKEAFGELCNTTDIIVVEGAGSPAEINLRTDDIANMATAELTGSPVILVGDIDRGGVFAGIYGTYLLVPAHHRHQIKGFLINRFRGDPSILGSGIDQLESLMGIPCIGVLPYLDLRFPSEDSLDLERPRGSVASGTDVRTAWLANLDVLHQVSEKALDYPLLDRILEQGP